jgi:hypothetical protein
MKRAAFCTGFMWCNGDQDRKDHGQGNTVAAYLVAFFRCTKTKLWLLHCGAPIRPHHTTNYSATRSSSLAL